MTVPSGTILLGLRSRDGQLVVVPTRNPLSGEYAVLAGCADGERVALSVQPMRTSGDVGFLGRCADSWPAALTGLFAAPPIVCIPELDLGFGLKYRIYPPVSLTIGNVNATPHGGRDAMIGKWADEIAGVSFGGGYHQPAGIAGTYSLDNMLLTAAGYPFAAPIPHHVVAEGVPDLDLSAYVPSGGYWFHAGARPLVMSKRWINGPGPLHDDTDPLFIPVEPSAGLPIDIRTQLQVFCNLSASLALESGPQIAINVNAFFLVLVGKAIDFNWGPPMRVEHPLSGNVMDCLVAGLEGSGIGTPCETQTPSGGVGSLGCFCICSAFDLSQCAWLDLSINALEQSNHYYACGAGNPRRRFRETALWASASGSAAVAWPHGDAVTEANVLDAFNHPGPLSRLVADTMQSSLGSVDIQNTHNADRLETDLEAAVSVDSVSTSEAAVDGPEPLPVVEVGDCFGGTTPTLRKVALGSIDAWLESLKESFFHVVTYTDVANCAYNPDLRNDLIAALGQDVASDRAAYIYLCRLWEAWKATANIRANLKDAWTLTDVPLRTDCFPGGGGVPPGVDPQTGELVFGYDGPADAGLFGSGYWGVDFAQQNPVLVSLIAPSENGPNWRELVRGGKVPVCNVVYPLDNCLFWPDLWYCEGNWPEESLCEGVGEDWDVGSFDWPRLYGFQQPALQVRILISGCEVKVRAHCFDWWVRESTCWYRSDEHICPNGCYANDDVFGGGPGVTTGFGFFEVGRGASTFLQADWIGEPVETRFGYSALSRNLWSQMQSLGRMLNACNDTDPEPIEVAGRGNSLLVYV